MWRVGEGIVHTDAEKCVVVPHRVVGSVRAQDAGELDGGAFVVGFARYQLEGAGGVAHMHIEWDEKLRGFEHIPHAEVHDAVVAHEPAEGHVDALEGGGGEVERQAAGVGGTVVGGSQLAVELLHERPCGELGMLYSFGGCKIVERSVGTVDGVEAAQEMAQVAGEEGAVDVDVGEILVGTVHHKIVGLHIHQGEHLADVVANHLAVAPGNGGGEKRGDFNIGQG